MTGWKKVADEVILAHPVKVRAIAEARIITGSGKCLTSQAAYRTLG